ncbi:MAG: amino acid synthesis family protein [Hylemonella sp.]
MKYHIRSWSTFSEEILANETGEAADGAPVRKFAVVCVLENPYAGRFSRDLSLLINDSAELGQEFGSRLKALSADLPITSYGKACVVGTAGEYEHGNALLTTQFADPVRASLGGGKAWISSTGKRGGPGTTIDVPLAHKDALYVRSHYDTMTITLHDAPMPNEIAVIFCTATRGRLHARLGGLLAADIKGLDGLR